VEAANEHQKTVLLRKVSSALGRLDGVTVAVWGLAFKAGTDDMRGSPAIPLIDGLLEGNARVVAHDPHAGVEARKRFGARVALVDDPYCALKGASALVVVTEWLQYRTPDFDRIRSAMARPLVIDGRNLWEPGRMRRAGFEYHGIGRAAP
jgi:UDPglucose 6-dehydrogenase